MNQDDSEKKREMNYEMAIMANEIPSVSAYEIITGSSKISSKGQVTVPVDVRKALQIQDGDELRFVVRDGVAYIEVVQHLSADELFGILNGPDDNGNFVLDLDAAKEKRARQILRGVTDFEEN